MKGRERVRAAERATQEADFAERRCRDRLAELERRRSDLAAQGDQQRTLLAQAVHRARRHRLDAGRAVARDPARRAGIGRAGAGRRARPARGARCRPARGGGGTVDRGPEARARARQDPGHAIEGAGGESRRAAVHRAARRRESGRSRAARGTQGVGERAHAAGGDRAPARGDRRARRGEPRRPGRAGAGARAQGLPRPASGRSDRGHDHAGNAIRQIDRESRSCCSRRSTRSTPTSPSSSRRCSAAATRSSS